MELRSTLHACSDAIDCHFKGLNVLGMDFLAKADLKLTIDMGSLRVTISKE